MQRYRKTMNSESKHRKMLQHQKDKFYKEIQARLGLLRSQKIKIGILKKWKQYLPNNQFWSKNFKSRQRRQNVRLNKLKKRLNFLMVYLEISLPRNNSLQKNSKQWRLHKMAKRKGFQRQRWKCFKKIKRKYD